MSSLFNSPLDQCQDPLQQQRLSFLRKRLQYRWCYSEDVRAMVFEQMLPLRHVFTSSKSEDPLKSKRNQRNIWYKINMNIYVYISK